MLMAIFTWCCIVLAGWVLNMAGGMLLMDRDVFLPDALALTLLLIPGANFITAIIIVTGSAVFDVTISLLGVALMMLISVLGVDLDGDDDMW